MTAGARIGKQFATRGYRSGVTERGMLAFFVPFGVLCKRGYNNQQNS
jgi:hypothetical protein